MKYWESKMYLYIYMTMPLTLCIIMLCIIKKQLLTSYSQCKYQIMTFSATKKLQCHQQNNKMCYCHFRGYKIFISCNLPVFKMYIGISWSKYYMEKFCSLLWVCHQTSVKLNPSILKWNKVPENQLFDSYLLMWDFIELYAAYRKVTQWPGKI